MQYPGGEENGKKSKFTYLLRYGWYGRKGSGLGLGAGGGFEATQCQDRMEERSGVGRNLYHHRYSNSSE